MVQYCDNNVEHYCIDIPIFDNLASDEIEGASEEDEAIALMVLASYFTPKQEDEEVIEEDGEEDLRKQDGEEDHGDGHVLSLFPKMQDVVSLFSNLNSGVAMLVRVRMGICLTVRENGDMLDNNCLPVLLHYAQEDLFSKEITSICSSSTSLSIKENRSDTDDHAQEKMGEEEDYKNMIENADRTCLKFKKRMDAYPEQCFSYGIKVEEPIGYCLVYKTSGVRFTFLLFVYMFLSCVKPSRLDTHGGKPLLATGGVVDPGICKLCGGSRHHEVQLMPPLLYFLHEEALDCQEYSLQNWNRMTLIVYILVLRTVPSPFMRIPPPTAGL
ncbi:programmed cell death 2 C-terminal domain-containing protein [Actinidia rufa]|uniref:Programmed cell death 2 C-terminal domain-containing protein n=1 Tax=Actinidia rufa TaxID=165716 RepID=A0A7J0G9N0_9ERIC|nr:programmed cell death 2 C-terminal domain-containing protein [Actinidia rufa]